VALAILVHILWNAVALKKGGILGIFPGERFFTRMIPNGIENIVLHFNGKRIRMQELSPELQKDIRTLVLTRLGLNPSEELASLLPQDGMVSIALSSDDKSLDWVEALRQNRVTVSATLVGMANGQDGPVKKLLHVTNLGTQIITSLEEGQALVARVLDNIADNSLGSEDLESIENALEQAMPEPEQVGNRRPQVWVLDGSLVKSGDSASFEKFKKLVQMLRAIGAVTNFFNEELWVEFALVRGHLTDEQVKELKELLSGDGGEREEGKNGKSHGGFLVIEETAEKVVGSIQDYRLDSQIVVYGEKSGEWLGVSEKVSRFIGIQQLLQAVDVKMDITQKLQQILQETEQYLIQA
jgi:hypothetical protein